MGGLLGGGGGAKGMLAPLSNYWGGGGLAPPAPPPPPPPSSYAYDLDAYTYDNSLSQAIKIVVETLIFPLHSFEVAAISIASCKFSLPLMEIAISLHLVCYEYVTHLIVRI